MWGCLCLVLILSVKSALRKFNFLISKPKHMLWVLKRTVSMRRFFLALKTYVKIDDLENTNNMTLEKFCLSKPVKFEY